MKKLVLLGLSLVFMLELTGCGVGEVAKDIMEQKDSIVKEVETISAVIEKASEELSSGMELASKELEKASSELEKASAELEKASQELDKSTGEVESTTEAQSEQAQKVDGDYAGLKDKALIMALANKLSTPENYHILMEISSEGMVMKTDIYKQGENLKNGVDYMNSGVMHYNIYNVDMGYQYSYDEGDSTGTKYKITEDYIDEGSFDLPEFDEQEFAEDDFEGLEEARLEFVDGKEMLYIRHRLEENSEVEIEEIWISVADRFPYKMTLKDLDGNIKMEMNVLEIETNKDFSKELQPPKNIEFTEL